MTHHSPSDQEITLILRDLGEGEASERAVSTLFTTVQDELRTMARRFMRGERQDHTLQATALVNEAFLKLVGGAPVTWENRAHFFGAVARSMRQILVDHARKRDAHKRGGEWERASLSEALQVQGTEDVDVLDLHDALEKLEAEDPRAAKVIELWFFGGLEQTEVAHVLGVTDRTVRNDWTFGRLWLARELGGEAEA